MLAGSCLKTRIAAAVSQRGAGEVSCWKVVS